MDLSTLEHDFAGAPQYDHDDAVLDLGTLSSQVRQQVLDRLPAKDSGVWADTIARVGNCLRPVRLRRCSDWLDPRTGEVLSSFSSTDHPLGVWCTSGAGIGGPQSARPAPACTPRTCSTSSGPASPAARPSPSRWPTTRCCSPHLRPPPSAACTHRVVAIPATRAAAAPTAAPQRAEWSTPKGLRARGLPACWASRCVRTATTTTPMWCGSGRP